MILISFLGLVWVNLCVVSWIGYHLDVDGFAFCFFFEVISVFPILGFEFVYNGKWGLVGIVDWMWMEAACARPSQHQNTREED